MHSVGETVGLVPHPDEAKEKKEEQTGASASSAVGAAPAASSPAYADWQKEHQQKEGILSSIANAARNVLVPPPLDADPVDERVVPVVPPGFAETKGPIPEESTEPKEEKREEKKEEKPTTFLGSLLQKVEHKIEEALPMIAPHLEEERKEESERKDKLLAEREQSAQERGSLTGEVRVSALGPVWEKEEEAGETHPGKLESSEETHGPAAAKRDASMQPIQDVGRYVIVGEPRVRKFTPARAGDAKFVEATPSLSGEVRVEPAPIKQRESPERAEIGDWEVDGGRVRHEEEYRGHQSDSTAKAKKLASGVTQEQLNRVAAAADKIMAQRAEPTPRPAPKTPTGGVRLEEARRTSISPSEVKADEFAEHELLMEFAPTPKSGGFAIKPPSETVAAGTKVEEEEKKERLAERKRDAKSSELTPLLHRGETREDYSAIVPAHKGYEPIEEEKEEKLPRGAEEKSESDAERKGAGDASEPIDKDKQVETLMKLVVEPLSKIDESKLPALTPEIAFSAPAAPHQPRRNKGRRAPKHTQHDRVPGRAEHHVNQPAHHQG